MNGAKKFSVRNDLSPLSHAVALVFLWSWVFLFGGIAWPVYGGPVKVEAGVYLMGTIQEPSLSESSGLVASRQRPGLFWTHNDQGHDPILFGMDRRGNPVSRHRIAVELVDWEDLAIDDAGHLYVADLGNNDAKRKELKVYQIKEPDPREPEVALVPLKSWTLRFPERPFDCESLFVDGGKGYVISKVFDDAQGEIYSFDLGKNKSAQTLTWVAKLPVTSPITGADLSSDRKRLGIVCKAGAYVFIIDGDVSSVERARHHRNKFKKGQIEACSFVEEGLLATAEGREIFLFTDAAYRSTP